MPVLGVHHVSVLVADLDKALAFYAGALGLTEAERPDLGYPGAWLQCGAQQIHLLRLDGASAAADARVSRDYHFALRVEDVDALARRLDDTGVPFERSRSGRRALFLRDPDGNGIECLEAANP